MTVLLALVYNTLIALYHLLTPRDLWRFRALRPVTEPPAAQSPRAAILVPMRDEASHVRRCLTALLDQRYPAERYEIIVIDDGSTDGTREQVARIIRERPIFAQPPLRLLNMPPLRQRWTGKSQALWWGAQAVADNVRWLLFVDADTFLVPEALATLVQEAEGRELALLSLMPRDDLPTWWEKVIVPVSLLQLQRSVNLAAVNDDRHPAAAAAAGQVMMVRHDAYASLGTHEAVRDELFENTAIARLMRRRRERVRLVNGFRLARTRRFDGLRALWESYQREAYARYYGSLHRVAIATLVTALLDLLPFLWPLLALRARRPRQVVLLLSSGTFLPLLAILYRRARTLRHFGISPLYALTHPIGVLAVLILSWSGVLRGLLRLPVEWKGREYGVARFRR